MSASPDPVVLSIAGPSVSQGQIERLRALVYSLLRGSRHKVILDVSSIDFPTSPLMAWLLTSDRLLREHGGRLMIAGGQIPFLAFAKCLQVSDRLAFIPSISEGLEKKE